MNPPLPSPSDHDDVTLKANGPSDSVEKAPSLDATVIDTNLAQSHLEQLGERIGPYKLLKQIGEGGFGVVWLAEQEQPVTRQVALKILKLGMDSKEIVARFEQERQALAMMDHPNIAKVFDAGATQNGRPYFVMELVRGVPITEFCDKQKLSVAARLELMIRVCHAIQHAHQKGIIHRDVKPSNILVAMGDDNEALPKVIDFGVSKAIDHALTEKTLFTQLGQMIGSPSYMSPEQADAGAIDIDTRCDIYALGVVLYEILTGKPPFDARELLRAGWDEMRRVIREEEPPKPSTRLSTLTGAALTGLATQRQVEAPKLIATVRGDLDWIVMKALEKNRDRRYETADGLALDLQRYLTSEPVLARPPSFCYKAGKFIRKHKGPVTAAGLVLFTLIAGVLVSSYLYLNTKEALAATEAARTKEAQQRVLAEANERKLRSEINKSSEIDGWLATFIVHGRDPVMKGDQFDPKRLGTMMDAMVKELQSRRGSASIVDGYFREMIGECYDRLGRYEDAQKQMEQARAIREKLLGSEHPDTLDTLYNLGRVCFHLKKLGEAEQLLRSTFEAQQRVLKAGDPRISSTTETLTMVYTFQGKRAEGAALKLQGPDFKKELLERGVSSAAKLVEINKRIRGAKDPETMRSMFRLAKAYKLVGKQQDAEVLLRELLPLQKAILGDQHPDTVATLFELGLTEGEQTQDQIQKQRQRSIETSMRLLGPEHPQTLKQKFYEACQYVRSGKYAEAEPVLLSIHDAMTGRDDIRLTGDSFVSGESASKRGSFMLRDTKVSSGIFLFRETLDQLVRLYEGWSKPDEAAKWQRALKAYDQVAAERNRGDTVGSQTAPTSAASPMRSAPSPQPESKR